MAIKRMVIGDISVQHKVEDLADFFRIAIGREGVGEAQRYFKNKKTMQLDGSIMVPDVKVTHFENL